MADDKDNIIVQELSSADKTLSAFNLNALYGESEEASIEELFGLAASDKEHTVLVLPSISVERNILENIIGINHYESRGLWEILNAKNSNIKILYISSLPIEQVVIDQLLSHIPQAKEIKKRIQFISLNNAEVGKSLTDKILSNIFYIKKIKSLIEPKNTYMNSFLVTESERKLAEVLGIPLFGSQERFDYYHTKSGNRVLFQESGVPFSPGFGDLKSIGHLVMAIENLWRRFPRDKKIMIKLDRGVSGEGNALLIIPDAFPDYSVFKKTIPDDEKRQFITNLLPQMKFLGKNMNWQNFHKEIAKGVVAERYLEGDMVSSPSCQGKIYPNGRVEILSTHEQILNELGNCYLGSEFPCRSDYRNQIQIYAMRVGKAMAKKGLIGYFSIDYLMTENQSENKIWAIEINIRQGGTTHPYKTAKLLTGSVYDEKKGILSNPKCKNIVYKSNDNFVDPRFIGKTPEQFLDFLCHREIIFSAATNRGVVFHILGAMNEFGKIGFTMIGQEQEQVNSMVAHLYSLIEEFLAT